MRIRKGGNTSSCIIIVFMRSEKQQQQRTRIKIYFGIKRIKRYHTKPDTCLIVRLLQ